MSGATDVPHGLPGNPAGRGDVPRGVSRDVPRDDVAAALETRRELGPDLEPEIVDSMVARIDAAIDARVRERLAELDAGRRAKDDGGATWIALGSLGMGIPITAIAGGTSGMPGVLAAWIGIALINVAYALSVRRAR